MSAHDTPEVGSGEAVGEWVRVYPLDDVALATCSGCDRSTWSAQEVGRTCSMRQPDGSRCAGQFTPASPDPVQPADAGEGRQVVLGQIGEHVEATGLSEAEVGEIGRAMRQSSGNGCWPSTPALEVVEHILAAREAAWAEKYAAVVGERDRARLSRDATKAAMVRQIRARKSAEAALATALREKAEDRARVEAVEALADEYQAALDTSSPVARDRAPVEFILRDLRAALAIPTATGDE